MLTKFKDEIKKEKCIVLPYQEDVPVKITYTPEPTEQKPSPDPIELENAVILGPVSFTRAAYDGAVRVRTQDGVILHIKLALISLIEPQVVVTGSRTYYGKEAPDAAIGAKGDVWIDSEGKVYQKELAWVEKSSIGGGDV